MADAEPDSAGPVWTGCRYRLLVFDWDGTLMDSAPRIVACMQRAARAFGWAVPSAEAIRDIIGLGLPEAIERLYPGTGDRDREALQQAYGEAFRAADQSPAPFFDHVAEGLERLHGVGGCHMVVATGKSRRGLDRTFAHTEASRWFVDSRTADLTRSKPHPLMLEELLDAWGVAVADAVMVGDTEYDLEMARAIGMDRIAVTYGVHDRHRLERSEPILVADDFRAVVDWLLGADR
ncbi:HAD family hydrolase [Salinicola aestuarinus]|uniref:HAD family hydrolase n=1 Tax=Salinicola aestuarinus TaxID=1949082 RepID=UPI002477D121|nr:HAD-IA family hydrolase [Salinicola aestuarinus]